MVGEIRTKESCEAMKRISKKRLAAIRAWVSRFDGKNGPTAAEVLALLDAYERRPDEVAEGPTIIPAIMDDNWTDGGHGKTIMIAPGNYTVGRSPVRVEVYYLKESRRG